MVTYQHDHQREAYEHGFETALAGLTRHVPEAYQHEARNTWLRGFDAGRDVVEAMLPSS